MRHERGHPAPEERAEPLDGVRLRRQRRREQHRLDPPHHRGHDRLHGREVPEHGAVGDAHLLRQRPGRELPRALRGDDAQAASAISVWRTSVGLRDCGWAVVMSGSISKYAFTYKLGRGTFPAGSRGGPRGRGPEPGPGRPRPTSRAAPRGVPESARAGRNLLMRRPRADRARLRRHGGALHLPFGPPARAGGQVLRLRCTNYVDRCHNQKEEQHLFPLLEQRGIPRQSGPLAVMLAEHEQPSELLSASSPWPAPTPPATPRRWRRCAQPFGDYARCARTTTGRRTTSSSRWRARDTPIPTRRRWCGHRGGGGRARPRHARALRRAGGGVDRSGRPAGPLLGLDRERAGGHPQHAAGRALLRGRGRHGALLQPRERATRSSRARAASSA